MPAQVNFLDRYVRSLAAVLFLAALFLPSSPAESAAELPLLPVLCVNDDCVGRIYVSAEAEENLFCGGRILDRTNQHPDMLLVYAGYRIGKKKHLYDTAYTAGITREGRKVSVRDIKRVEVRSGKRRLCEANVVSFH